LEMKMIGTAVVKSGQMSLRVLNICYNLNLNKTTIYSATSQAEYCWKH